MYYRVRTRVKGLNGRNEVIADKLPNLEEVYDLVIREGKGKARHFYYVDEVNGKEINLFSKVTAKVAEQRLNEIRYEKEKQNGK